MFTLIISFGIMFAKFSSANLPFSPLFPHCLFWNKVSMNSPHLRTGKLCFTSLSVKHLCKLFGNLLHLRFAYYSHLFTNLCQHLFISKVLCFQITSLYYFAACIVLAYIIERYFSWLLYAFHIISFYYFQHFFKFLALQDTPKLSCIILVPRLGAAISSRSSGLKSYVHTKTCRNGDLYYDSI